MDPPSIFSLGESQCFVEKGSLLCSGEPVFWIKGVPFMSPKVSVLKKGVIFSVKKSVERGLYKISRAIVCPPYCSCMAGPGLNIRRLVQINPVNIRYGYL